MTVMPTVEPAPSKTLKPRLSKVSEADTIAETSNTFKLSDFLVKSDHTLDLEFFMKVNNQDYKI